MYRQKLNPRIFNHFQTISKPEVGLMCMLKLPTANKYTNSSEIQRFSRLEELKLRQTLTKSATILQKNTRTFLAKQKLKRLKTEKELQVKAQKSTQIQALYRGYKARIQTKLLKLSTKLSTLRTAAAKLIQKNFRIHQLKYRLHILILIHRLIYIRNSAALRIQKVTKGYLVRKDLKFMRHKNLCRLVRWRYFAKSVSIAGSFTFPPWQVEIPLLYSKFLKGFYSAFFIENKLKAGEYCLKFIVDGCWLCDGHYKILQDSAGNYNNAIEVVVMKKERRRAESVRVGCWDAERWKNRLGMRNGLLIDGNCNVGVKFIFGSASMKEVGNGAFCRGDFRKLTFFDEEIQSFGVGSERCLWNMFGIEEGKCAIELLGIVREGLKNSAKVLKNSMDKPDDFLRNLLGKAWKKMQNVENAGVLFGFCWNNTVNALNLGNSRLVIFRKIPNSWSLMKVFASDRQRDSFEDKVKPSHISEDHILFKSYKNRCLKLTQQFSSINSENSDFFSINIQPDDIILIASSGILDNLFDEDLCTICETILKQGLTFNYFCEKTAKTIAEEAFNKGKDHSYKSPYWKDARLSGRVGIGGRLKDFGVIVGIAADKNY